HTPHFNQISKSIHPPSLMCSACAQSPYPPLPAFAFRGQHARSHGPSTFLHLRDEKILRACPHCSDAHIEMELIFPNVRENRESYLSVVVPFLPGPVSSVSASAFECSSNLVPSKL